MWDPGPTARAHKPALLSSCPLSALPWSQGRTELLEGRLTPAMPRHSQLKQQQCLNAESKVVSSKDNYKALSKAGTFEQIPSSLKLLTYLQ